MNRRDFTLMLAAGLALPLLPRPIWAQDAAAPEVPDMVLGNPDAKVMITEYASFTCPHCANFHTNTWPSLKKDYIDTGKIRFTYREVYFDRFGLWAAMVARCGGEMRYFGIADMLYDTQSEWLASGDPATIAGELRKIGRKAGLDDAALTACLEDQKMAEALVAAYQANATADGVNSTPSFVIGGTTHKNMSYDEMKALIDAELAK
jgi:protein-disulfide isomerase